MDSDTSKSLTANKQKFTVILHKDCAFFKFIFDTSPRQDITVFKILTISKIDQLEKLRIRYFPRIRIQKKKKPFPHKRRINIWQILDE